MKKYIIVISACLLAAALGFSMLSFFQKKEKYTSTYYEYFDTVSTLTVYTSSREHFEVCDTIFKTELEKYHCLLDMYREYDDVTNICTLNAMSGGTAVVSAELFAFLEASIEMYERTEGYTSLALGAVTELWKQAITDKSLPDRQALDEAVKHTNIDDIVLEGLDKTVELKDSELKLDAGALGKGYVSDIIRDALLEAGCESFLIDLGGTLTGFGQKSNSEDWYGGIHGTDDADISVDISGVSMSTSGSYYRGFELDGTRYHHIIDPVTAYPKNTYVSVSVICRSAFEADALSTAMFSMSTDSGRALEASLEYGGVLWLYENGCVEYTEGFEGFLKK